MGFEVDLDFLLKMLKNASLCVVFYFLDSKHFRNCFPHALMENAQENVSDHGLRVLGLKDPSLANCLLQGQPYQSRGQCKEKEQAYLGSARVKGRWRRTEGSKV